MIVMSKLKPLNFDNYSTFFVDMVGVIYDGLHYFPKALEAISSLQKEAKEVVFVSNNPRPSSITKKKLLQIGLNEPFSVVTSGDYARHLLQTTYKNAKIFHLGAQRNKDILKGLEVNLVQDSKACDLVLLTLFLEENEDPNDYEEILGLISSQKKEVLCANPDYYALHGDAYRKCSGFFADLLLKKGANVRIIGKPSKDFYDFVVKTAVKDFNPQKTLMIGDTLETDILGATLFGIDSLLVKTGVSAQKGKLSKDVIIPTYVEDSLVIK